MVTDLTLVGVVIHVIVWQQGQGAAEHLQGDRTLGWVRRHIRFALQRGNQFIVTGRWQ